MLRSDKMHSQYRRLLLLKKKLLLLNQAKRRRRFWIHPINNKREEFGLFRNLIQELRGDEERFKKYFRMTVHTFDHLLAISDPYLKKQDTRMRKAIEPELKLALTLHHLAEGASHSAIAAHYRLGRSTTSVIIYDTCKVLWKVLQPIYLKAPNNPAEWEAVAARFVSKTGTMKAIAFIIASY